LIFFSPKKKRAGRPYKAFDFFLPTDILRSSSGAVQYNIAKIKPFNGLKLIEGFFYVTPIFFLLH